MARDWRIEAGRIWPVLVEAAARRQTLTAARLSERTKVTPRSLRQPLDIIAKYCFQKALPQLPPLPIVIIGIDKTAKPGEGVVGTSIERYTVDLQRVFDHRWQSVQNPFAVFSSTV
jgi:hypothetical protein